MRGNQQRPQQGHAIHMRKAYLPKDWELKTKKCSRQPDYHVGVSKVPRSGAEPWNGIPMFTPLSTSRPPGTGRKNGVSGNPPSSRRGATAKDSSTVRKSLVLTVGETTCQLLLVESVPVANESLLPPMKEILLRTTWGVVFAPWFKLKLL